MIRKIAIAFLSVIAFTEEGEIEARRLVSFTEEGGVWVGPKSAYEEHFGHEPNRVLEIKELNENDIVPGVVIGEI